MVEGVLAVGTDGRVIAINQAAAEMLGVKPEAVEGRRLEDTVPHRELIEFVSGALKGSEPVEGDIVLRSDAQKSVQAHGTPLSDAHGKRIGVVIVLNDITRLRQVETMRRDFVANVSHELRTPITSIKGFVETLLDGAMEDPDAARRFLEIVGRQADRLNAIIEDLLLLSTIEEGGEKSRLTLQATSIKDVLGAAAQVCSLAASAKKMTVEIECPDALSAKINAPLVEQALVNLIDNAIKYSEPGSPVSVEANQSDAEVSITVRDQGAGIAPEHLPRIFERFYRVDKARSRKLGGTGLGLAIVKHIAQLHGGTATVESTLGKGSAFTIRIPRR